ncbi:putative calmodulin-like [Cocos nucifera]|uniref:Putative calmodulin-like n=1 Tax=Cocos nucifera TaxID=13894 RepID=A0A8K0IRR5_COCNU|nr:putative calmodulin-like [Cocos nucifera]
MRPVTMPPGHPIVPPPHAARDLAVRPLVVPPGHPTVLPPHAARALAVRPLIVLPGHPTMPYPHVVRALTVPPPHAAHALIVQPLAVPPGHAVQTDAALTVPSCRVAPRHAIVQTLLCHLAMPSCRPTPPSPRNPKLKDWLKHVNLNGDGRINRDDLKQALHVLGLNWATVRKWLAVSRNDSELEIKKLQEYAAKHWGIIVRA